ncbi:hypothetical protein Tco_1447270, partial [Tanacetum coccineum]
GAYGCILGKIIGNGVINFLVILLLSVPKSLESGIMDLSMTIKELGGLPKLPTCEYDSGKMRDGSMQLEQLILLRVLILLALRVFAGSSTNGEKFGVMLRDRFEVEHCYADYRARRFLKNTRRKLDMANKEKELGWTSSIVCVEKPTIETNEPETSRKENGAPITEDWVSDSDEKNVPKGKTVKMFNKPSFVR